jgi:hypothetical protein
MKGISLVSLAVGLVACGPNHPAAVEGPADPIVTETVPDAAAPPREVFTVHEWGTFTALSDREGTLQRWSPLQGSIELPDFVYAAPAPERAPPEERPDPKGQITDASGHQGTLIRMETPVLYFHSSRESTVSVAVDFPGGEITEWYPAATVTPHRIEWPSVQLTPGVELTGNQNDVNPYFHARETDATIVQVGDDAEGFLFYRGAGEFFLPLQAKLGEHTVDLVTVDVPALIVFERTAAGVGYQVVDAPPTQLSVARPALDDSVEALEADLLRLLTGQGLTDQEAHAMVATWRDFWFEDGLRVFYLVPRGITDDTIRLSISPSPDETVRVLVGRMEILTPELEQQITDQVRKLADRSKTVSDAAMVELRRLGRFARPVLERLRRSASTKVRQQIDSLL